MSEIQIPPNGKSEFYQDLPEDLLARHCRTCVNFKRPSLPYLSGWGKCSKNVVTGWCRDFFPACNLFENRTHNQMIFETALTYFVIAAAIFALIKFVALMAYFFSHGLPPLPPEVIQQQKDRSFF